MAKKCKKERDARAALLFCQSKPIALLTFSSVLATMHRRRFLFIEDKGNTGLTWGQFNITFTSVI